MNRRDFIRFMTAAAATNVVGIAKAQQTQFAPQVVYNDGFCASTGLRATGSVMFRLEPYSEELENALRVETENRKDALRRLFNDAVSNPTAENKMRVGAQIGSMIGEIVHGAETSSPTPARIEAGYRIQYPLGACTPAL